ncbi:hypothetical protein F6R98_19345 [Candidatus Methylospira mobilis]|uniref:Uncharacterized protein n=1 Tax=Candidatus Methylospira mobilis TaxID=1808979 RepID=A0A5Q0BR14_9GAMM|nr:hypothetical protein [Candidatus Methylospira mobilis]QFY44518.1 hypothetical protein F6R98_19345 [Candidatus Methylospira mobilis]WNV06048.1 hypothetical protein RP726_06420 [Candidatus Methylospira mobilis]
MMTTCIRNRRKSKSLKIQIRDAEQQLSNRQRRCGVRAATLTRKIHQQLIAPASLLLAGSIGFIIGEFTKRQIPNNRGAADKPDATETTPLRTALKLMASARTIYAALPLAWIMRSLHHPDASGQPPKRRFYVAETTNPFNLSDFQ